MTIATPSLDFAGEIDEILPGVIADRRHLHQHPELAFEEVETARFVAERLRSLGLEEIRTGIAVTGVTGLIRGTGPGQGKVVLLRADMDALPIQEQNDIDYRSTVDGKMHACGHDAHTAMLLGVARLLMARRDQFSGTVKLCFQPAEEKGGGGRVMVEAGVLEEPRVDLVFGQHVGQGFDRGTIAFRPGPMLAAVDDFRVVITGKGGHGARPHDCIDPIAVGVQVVSALQTLVAREIDPTEPAVVTVGAFLAGEASNVIPNTAELRGTLRSFSPAVRFQLQEAAERLVTGVAAAMRAEASFELIPGYPATVNDPTMAALVREVAAEVVGADGVIVADRRMGAEDFSYFLEQRPGCFWFVGTRNTERGLTWGGHHPKFDIDEEAMAIGIETMCRVALRALADG